MDKSLLPMLGFIGNILLVIAYIPQVYKTLKSKKADDISITMWLIYLVGELMLLAYTFSINDLNFIILLTIFCLGDLAIIGLKLKYGFKKSSKNLTPNL